MIYSFRANVIDVTKIENEGKVIFGSTVTVKDLDKGGENTFIKLLVKMKRMLIKI